METSKNEEKVVSEIQAASPEPPNYGATQSQVLMGDQRDAPFFQAQMSSGQNMEHGMGHSIGNQASAEISHKSLNERDSANNQIVDFPERLVNEISDFVDEEDDDAENKRGIIENLNNIVGDDTISADTGQQVRSNNTGLGGDQFTRGMQVKQNVPLYQSFLSQQDKPNSQQSSLAKNYNHRRISEHEPNLVGSETNWPQGYAIEQEANYWEVNDASSSSKANIRGSGQNSSDGVLSQPPQEGPPLSQADMHTSQGTLSHNDHVSPDSEKEKRTDLFGETPVRLQDSRQKPSSLGAQQNNTHLIQFPLPNQHGANFRDGYDQGFYDGYQGQQNSGQGPGGQIAHFSQMHHSKVNQAHTQLYAYEQARIMQENQINSAEQQRHNQINQLGAAVFPTNAHIFAPNLYEDPRQESSSAQAQPPMKTSNTPMSHQNSSIFPNVTTSDDVNLNMYQTPRQPINKAFVEAQQMSGMSTFENTPQIAQYSADRQRIIMPMSSPEMASGGKQHFNSGSTEKVNMFGGGMSRQQHQYPQQFHPQYQLDKSSGLFIQQQQQPPNQYQVSQQYQHYELSAQQQSQLYMHNSQRQNSPMSSGHQLLQTISQGSATPSPAKFHPSIPEHYSPRSSPRGQQQQQQQHPIPDCNRFMFQHPNQQHHQQQQYMQHQQQQQFTGRPHGQNLSPQQQHQMQMLSMYQSPQQTAGFYGDPAAQYHPPQSHQQLQQQQHPSQLHYAHHPSNEASMQLMSQNFADLQINAANFHGANSRNQIDEHQHLQYTNNAVRQNNKHLEQKQPKNASSGGNQNRNQANQKPSKQYGSKSLANSSNKSGFSDMISNSYNGLSGSQKTQTTAISNTATEGGTSGSGSHEQHLQLLIEKMQSLPATATWTEKQAILSGNITRLVTTQTGSKYLQNSQLSKSNPVLIEFLLAEIGEQLSPIMRNQYGNYFFQKLLSNCSVQQRLQILHLIKDDFIKICCHKQGTHTIQAILDNVTTEEEENFIKQALQGHIYELSIDEQGTHVIRKVLQCRSFDQDRQSFIFQKIYDNLNQLCKNKQGLCVIKIIINLTKTTEMKKRVISQILQDLIELVSDPYGNYAVSTIVEKWEPKICQPIFHKLANKISELSIQKYSSCVIEKCLESRDRETRSIFIREISETPRLFALVSHNYGNFVIQKALKLAHGREKDSLVEAIQQCAPQIQDKKIRAKWQEIIENSSGDFIIEQRSYADYPYSNSPENDKHMLHQTSHDPYYEQHSHHQAQSSYYEQPGQAAENIQNERYEYRQKPANNSSNNSNNPRQNQNQNQMPGQKRGGFTKRGSNASNQQYQASQAAAAGSSSQGSQSMGGENTYSKSSTLGNSQASSSQRGFNSNRSYGNKNKKQSQQAANSNGQQKSSNIAAGARNSKYETRN